MNRILKIISSILNAPLAPVGHTMVTPALILYLVILFLLLVLLSRLFRRRVVDRFLVRSKFDRNMQNAFAMLVQYSMIGVGGVIILNTAGIDMGALTVVAGTLGLGLSLGLQTVAKNVAGGIMILMERPIKIGDRISIGATSGVVTNIALRATTILNDDHVDIIVPNSDFMDQRVSNWNYSSRDVILNITVVVSADNDLNKVQKIMHDTAGNHSKVLAEPEPQVLLDSFEGGKFKFVLRVATDDYLSAATSLKSELNNDIFRQFKNADIKLDA